jgi:hypothetical protein
MDYNVEGRVLGGLQWLNLRQLPPPSAANEHGIVHLRWDTPTAPEFWLEVDWHARNARCSQVRGRGVPSDSVVSLASPSCVRWDSPTHLEFWLQVTLSPTEHAM